MQRDAEILPVLLSCVKKEKRYLQEWTLAVDQINYWCESAHSHPYTVNVLEMATLKPVFAGCSTPPHLFWDRTARHLVLQIPVCLGCLSCVYSFSGAWLHCLTRVFADTLQMFFLHRPYSQLFVVNQTCQFRAAKGK